MHVLNRKMGRLLATVLVLLGLVGGWFALRAGARADPPAPSAPLSPSQASVHNAGFDNHLWYEFNDRYKTWYAESWVPDDDVIHGPQDWRLWYIRGTPLVQSFPENVIIQGGVESVALRVYDGTTMNGGLYQTVYDVVPCTAYTFEIYGRSQPDSGQYPEAVLQAGIDRVGWHTNPRFDPAVPGAFPSTTVWGEAHDYKREFGKLSVTAEAWADQITVYARAYAGGGRRHAIVWDSASLVQQPLPEVLHDPTNLPAPGGVSNLSVTPGRGSAGISWHTDVAAMGQVYYRLLPSGWSIVMPPHDPYYIYVPFVSTWESSKDWTMSPIYTPQTDQVVFLDNLLPGRSYAFVVVARGSTDGQCVTWVSDEQYFTTYD